MHVAQEAEGMSEVVTLEAVMDSDMRAKYLQTGWATAVLGYTVSCAKLWIYQ